MLVGANIGTAGVKYKDAGKPAQAGVRSISMAMPSLSRS
jgi:hypothetical protein